MESVIKASAPLKMVEPGGKNIFSSNSGDSQCFCSSRTLPQLPAILSFLDGVNEAQGSGGLPKDSTS